MEIPDIYVKYSHKDCFHHANFILLDHIHAMFFRVTDLLDAYSCSYYFSMFVHLLHHI